MIPVEGIGVRRPGVGAEVSLAVPVPDRGGDDLGDPAARTGRRNWQGY